MHPVSRHFSVSDSLQQHQPSHHATATPLHETQNSLQAIMTRIFLPDTTHWPLQEKKKDTCIMQTYQKRTHCMQQGAVRIHSARSRSNGTVGGTTHIACEHIACKHIACERTCSCRCLTVYMYVYLYNLQNVQPRGRLSGGSQCMRVCGLAIEWRSICVRAIAVVLRRVVRGFSRWLVSFRLATELHCLEVHAGAVSHAVRQGFLVVR
jgi:hypothetical protein